MSSFGVMLARIDRELRRDGITADISNAIETAIKEYAGDRFKFNEAEASANLTAGARTIALPTDFLEVDTLQAQKNGDYYDLEQIGKAEMDEMSPSTLTGTPSRYCIYRNQIEMDRFADASYPLKIAYQKELTGVSASSTAADTNAWMTEGEEMIRLKAKALVFADRLRNPEMANYFDQRAQHARLRTRQRSVKGIATGNMAKRSF